MAYLNRTWLVAIFKRCADLASGLHATSSRWPTLTPGYLLPILYRGIV